MINEPSILVWIQDIIVHEKAKKHYVQLSLECLQEAIQVFLLENDVTTKSVANFVVRFDNRTCSFFNILQENLLRSNEEEP